MFKMELRKKETRLIDPEHFMDEAVTATKIIELHKKMIAELNEPIHHQYLHNRSVSGYNPEPDGPDRKL